MRIKYRFEYSYQHCLKNILLLISPHNHLSCLHTREFSSRYFKVSMYNNELILTTRLTSKFYSHVVSLLTETARFRAKSRVKGVNVRALSRKKTDVHALASILLQIDDVQSQTARMSQYHTLRSRPGVNLSPSILIFRERYITQGATVPHQDVIARGLSYRTVIITKIERCITSEVRCYVASAHPKTGSLR